MIKTRKIRKDTLPDATKLVVIITNGNHRFKLKKKYENQSTGDLRKDATTFIDAVLVGDIGILQDEDVSLRVLARKVYMKDKF